MRRLAAVLSLTLAAAPAAAELQLPQASPAAAVRQVVGVTEIEVTYHRPAVRGRTIWGGLVPYGELWRLGANEATTIRFGDPVKVAGRDVPAGTYALFAIPGKEKWTIVLNRKAEQWGTYAYKPEDDLFRFEVAPEKAPFSEWMAFAVDPVGAEGARVELRWEELKVGFDVAVDVKGAVWKRVDEAIAGAKAEDQTTFVRAVQYSLRTGERRAEAWQWMEAVKKGKATARTVELEADLLRRDGRNEEAVVMLAKARELAAGAASPEALDALDKKLAEWKKAGG